ncbi:MAG: class I SAM-dependent methyltransferase [Candidatus Omnitrophica bacterium]|nr:class I SAM-dependent methyltransferase [Candidatus Omnitrophota bacterium]
MSHTCILCHSDKFKVVIQKNGYSMVKCANCDLVFTYPKPAEKDLTEFYQKAYRIDLNGYFRKRPIFEDCIECIECYVPKKGSLLEIGCSYGLFLDIARERGWQVSGIELSSSSRFYAEKTYGLTVYNNKLNETPLFKENTFDVVALWHVLEHFPNPLMELKNINFCLKPGGIVALALPNFRSLQSRILTRYWEWVDPFVHLYQFDIVSIKKLLNKAGFEVVCQKSQRGDSKGLFAHIVYYLFRLAFFIIKTSGVIFLKLRNNIARIDEDKGADKFRSNLDDYLETVLWPMVLKTIRPVDFISYMVRQPIYQRMLGPELFVLAKKS